MCLKSVLRTNWTVDCGNFFLQRECVHASEEHGVHIETTFLFFMDL